MSQVLDSTPSSTSFARWIPFLGLALGLAGCSGASSSAGAVGSESGPFLLTTISVSQSQPWQINRPISFSFSTAVDFDTVNPNTISIEQPGGGSSIGEYTMDPSDPRTVIFQPVCPTLSDFSDAGFRPGGVNYQINVPTTATGTITVRSSTGKPLTTSFARSFSTVDSAVLTELFLDPVPGPPRPVIVPGLGSSVTVGSGAAASELFFSVQSDGTGALPGGTLLPSNFYSDPDTRVVVRLRFDQPVSPLSENFASDRLRLEFLNGAGVWQLMNTANVLDSNCSGTGATVRILPLGVMPQGRPMRLVVTPQFEDLVGDRNASTLQTFGLMTADAELDGSGLAAETADEFLEGFLSPAFEDVEAPLAAPRADWGPDGLKAAFAFDGTGGPNGEFDIIIPNGIEVIFDTTSTTFSGGPGGVNTSTQLALNGRLDVRDLIIRPGATLRIQGPNAATILASRNVLVEGTLTVDGASAKSVFSLNTPTQPENGAAGQGGGGAGGIGSFMTTQVTQRGGNGQGAFGSPNLGGEGGESGYSTITGSQGIFHRAAGGGGGRMGHDQEVINTVGPPLVLCPDQVRIGLDTESGFPGHAQAISSQGAHAPYGGHGGPSPFGLLVGIENDFLGTKLMNIGQADERLVVGELTVATPGSGGGAGGDGTALGANETYPPPLSNVASDKGAGGGGGAGALTILALGDITVGSSGKISARGGHGNGGENTNFVNRVGGGSGGGSGGHLILQTAGVLDLSAASIVAGFPALDAKGGQGGEGAGGQGGAFTEETTPGQDAKHPGFDNDSGDNGYLTGDLAVPPECAVGANIVRAAGGDGGPGLIQIHVGSLTTDILYPTNEANLRTISSPVPHGYDPFTSSWRDQLLPVFGRLSSAQSKWIAVGEASVDPFSVGPQAISFLFEGTSPVDGRILSTAGVVDSQSALLSSAVLLLDASDTTNRTALMDGTGLLGGANEIYTRNPNLLRNFRLTVAADRFSVASASYNAGSGQFSLVVDNTGPDLAGLAGAVELIPRYFALATSGQQDALPASASVEVQFDLRFVNFADDTDVQTTGFKTDLADALDDFDQNLYALRFVRYRVDFDITNGLVDLDASTPRPSLEFLRLPFRF